MARQSVACAALAVLCTVTLATHATAQAPTLVAKVYPGAVVANMKVGKVVPCGLGEDHHDAYCYLTRDPIAKVREFYARDGITFDSIPIGKDQNAKGDGLYDLEEAVRLQLNRDATGLIFAAPVEWWHSRSSADEPSYFNSVIAMTSKAAGPLQGSAEANKAAILADDLFGSFALRPATAAIYAETIELLVSPERLVALYNKHAALRGSYFTKDGGSTAVARLLDSARTRRTRAAMSASSMDAWKTPDNKTKAIDALRTELDQQAYPTLILIQRSRKDGVTRDTATVAKEWRSAIRAVKSK